MSKHFFMETKALGDKPEYHRVIYCQWCGLVVWDFNKDLLTNCEFQRKSGETCKANLRESDKDDE